MDDKANAADVYTKTQTDQKIASLIDSAPDALNTLNELAHAINNDAAYATNIVSSIAAKADKANPAFTGNASVEGNLTIGGTFRIGETFQIDPNTGIPQAMVNGLTSALSAKQTSLTFSVPPANGFSLLNNSTVRWAGL